MPSGVCRVERDVLMLPCGERSWASRSVQTNAWPGCRILSGRLRTLVARFACRMLVRIALKRAEKYGMPYFFGVSEATHG